MPHSMKQIRVHSCPFVVVAWVSDFEFLISDFLHAHPIASAARAVVKAAVVHKIISILACGLLP